MLITMAGCGALGSLLAARLIEGGCAVQVFQRPGAQLDALKQHGIRIRADRRGTDTCWQPRAASDDADALELSPLIIVLVKSGDTRSVDAVRTLLALDGVVLSLQNGLGNLEQLAELFPANQLAAGTATYGAHRIEPGVIGWGGDGLIRVGPWLAGTDLHWVTQRLSDAGLNAEYVSDPLPALWTKLALNLMTNPPTALTGLRNGELTATPALIELMAALGHEAVTAARRADVALDFDSLWRTHLNNLQTTATNRSSMLADVESGRATEIDAIAGPILALTDRAGDFPFTRMLHALIKAKTHDR